MHLGHVVSAVVQHSGASAPEEGAHHVAGLARRLLCARALQRALQHRPARGAPRPGAVLVAAVDEVHQVLLAAPCVGSLLHGATLQQPAQRSGCSITLSHASIAACATVHIPLGLSACGISSL